VRDIDAERRLIWVEQGKGRKDRYSVLSPRLLERLRRYQRVYRLCPKDLRPCHSSFPRKRESILEPHPAWIPAFAGMTDPLSRLFGQSPLDL
jgi:integrase